MLQRLSSGIALLVLILEQVLERKFGFTLLDSFYGWDPPPASPTPLADLVASRTMTLVVGKADDGARLGTTLVAVSPEHGGPGLLLSFSGSLDYNQSIGNTLYRFSAGATGAADIFIPFGSSPNKFAASGDPTAFFRVGATRGKGQQEPAIRIGEPGKSRLEVGKLAWGIEFASDRAALRFALEDAAIFINLGQADNFLKSTVSSGELKLGFQIGFTADTNGFHLDGGTRARVLVPIGRTILSTVTVHHIELGLGPSHHGRDFELEMSGAFALRIGPFAASVDRLGMTVDMAFRDGNLRFIDLGIDFKPPNGIGLVLDAGIVKGGGYLFLDPDKGEYAGALELKFMVVGIKAIGILTTKMPDGSSGWALLLMIFGQFPPIQLGFGFVLTGIGGMIGLQHSTSIEGLQASLASGVLDDILFPSDPVAEAPRIINRLRTVFPVTPRALTIGPFLELGWGTPPLVTIRMGVIIQLDNALGGDRPASFSKIVILGQLRLFLPEEKIGVVKILCDFLGFYDFDAQRLGFVARLRDSRVAGTIELVGMLVVRVDFGAHPTFLIAAGGFSPMFQDRPADLPEIERIGVKVPVSPLLKLEGYFYTALTPATVQAGAILVIQYKLGPIDFSGSLEFHAIIYLQPVFHFAVQLKISIAVKFKGHRLAGISLALTVEGPGRWHAFGKATFSILFWDIDIDFDEAWGTAPQLPPVTTKVSQELASAMRDKGNWSAQLPAREESIVTLSPASPSTGILAHPLGRLVVTQKVAPLGLTLQRFGDTGIDGASKFEITAVKIGDGSAEFETVTEFFARAQFLNMTEEQKLSEPSFCPLASGASLGTSDFKIPDGLAIEVTYETKYLEPDNRLVKMQRLFAGAALTELESRASLEFDPRPLRLESAVVTRTVTVTEIQWQARHGAAAQSSRRQGEKLRPKEERSIAVNSPTLAVASKETMSAVGIRLTGLAAKSLPLALEAANLNQPDVGTQLVEEFELVGS